MKAVLLYAYGAAQLRREETDTPKYEDNEVLVKVLRVVGRNAGGLGRSCSLTSDLNAGSKS
jgi:NADPH:quinone reductase-like Zn-dependent oxidoreductase